MGVSDIFSDICAALVVQDVDAEEPPPSGEMNDENNQAANRNTRVEQTGGATTKGGASTSTSLSGTNEESNEEAEVNKKDAVRRSGNEDKGAGMTVHMPSNGSDNEDDNINVNSTVTASDEKEDKDAEDENEDEDEDEDEDEPVDPKPIIEEECTNSKQCSHHKDHYDSCVERVTQQVEASGKPDEDCVEEFFELAHCATQCAAPRLFQQLK